MLYPEGFARQPPPPGAGPLIPPAVVDLETCERTARASAAGIFAGTRDRYARLVAECGVE